MHSPGYSKPTHGYGIPFGPEFSPDQLLGAKFDTQDTGRVLDFEPLDETDLSEPECDLCPTPCSGCEKWERKNWAGKGFDRPYEES